MEQFKGFSRLQLERKLVGYILTGKQQQTIIMHQRGLLRHCRIKMIKIRNSIDFLLKHPYGNDSAMAILKHSRDTHNKRVKIK